MITEPAPVVAGTACFECGCVGFHHFTCPLVEHSCFGATPCDGNARGEVPETTARVDGRDVVVPAHWCRQCSPEHCELTRYLTDTTAAHAAALAPRGCRS